YTGYQKVQREGGVDLVQWRMDHTEMLGMGRAEIEAEGGCFVMTEDQNQFRIVSSKTGVTLTGKPDLIRLKGNDVLVVDIKTGAPREEHTAQVLLYMWALPVASSVYRAGKVEGRVLYKDHAVDLTPEMLTTDFTSRLFGLIRRISADEPARKVPSPRECG